MNLFGEMHPADASAFILYYLIIIAIGIYFARRKKERSEDYFLAGKKLPWYVVGASIISSNISTEHFIGMVGWAFIYGFAVANWEWLNFFTFSVLIWIFLPFYMRGGLYTMPEFLERRFNKHCRYIFAGTTIVQYVLAMMAVVLLAGGKALNGMFGIPVTTGSILLAATAGLYTIWGGLLSAAWIEFIQFGVLMGAGIMVTILALTQVGGIGELMLATPEKFTIFYPATHEMIPWTGLVIAAFTIGIWYNCTNQFIVQRCLAARTEWDGRMGVVFAGFAKIILPLVLVIPGIAAFSLYADTIGSQGDMAYPFLVRELLGPGLVGIVMAGLAAAIMSTISSVLNSSSTIFTIDVYRPLLRPRASENELILAGRLAGVVALSLATAIAVWLSYNPELTIFGLIQDIGAWVAAPVSAVFLFGMLFKRVTGPAATFVLVFGFPFTWFVQYVLFRDIAWLRLYDNFLHRTFIVWAVSVVALFLVSSLHARRRALLIGFWAVYLVLMATTLLHLFLYASASTVMAAAAAGALIGYGCHLALLYSRTPSQEHVEAIVWKPSKMRLAPAERQMNKGLRSLTLWWALFVGLILLLYSALFYFQLTH